MIIICNHKPDNNSLNISTLSIELYGQSRWAVYNAVKRHVNSTITSFNLAYYDDKQLVAFIETHGSTLKTEQVSINNLPQSAQNQVNQYNAYKNALEYAEKMHGNQTYSSLKLPYFYHLRQTDKVIDQFYDEIPTGKVFTLKTAALLHDIIEDTSVTHQEIKDNFGNDVADAVMKVTKIDEEHTPEYEANYYAEISKNPHAVIVKVADKAANTKQTVKEYSQWHADRIIKGHKAFQDFTYDKIVAPKLKRYLDGLVYKLEQNRGR